VAAENESSWGLMALVRLAAMNTTTVSFPDAVAPPSPGRSHAMSDVAAMIMAPRTSDLLGILKYTHAILTGAQS
jgi:hypothetical protein